jgi:hypothetical protein
MDRDELAAELAEGATGGQRLFVAPIEPLATWPIHGPNEPRDAGRAKRRQRREPA